MTAEAGGETAAITSSDVDIALHIYSMIAAGPEEWLKYLVIHGPPPSKQRPRFGRGGRVYTPAESRAAEERTSVFIRSSVQTPHTGNIALGCVFFRPNRQRIDVDNMLKHVCDAANGIAWHDDSQVTTLFGRVELDAENPRTLIIFGPDESTMMRGTDAWYPCPICETRIHFDGQTNPRKTCSRECAARVRGFYLLDERLPCAHCQVPFKRANKYQTMCSPECRLDSFRGKRKGRAGPLSLCLDCDKELSHRRGGRCRDCWAQSLKAQR